MAKKLSQPLFLKQFLLSEERRKKAGFTLTELLVSILIAGAVISALLSFVVDLLSTDRQEYARSETQREMQTALDFIVADLREAVYVYDNIEDPRNGAPRLTQFLPNFGSGVVPILAFWKAERLPYDSTQPLPANCNGYGPSAPNPSIQRVECDQLLIRRRAYTLVVYLQTTNPSTIWKGKSRIMRYVLRKYSNPSTLTRTPGYVDPSEISGFPNWPVGDTGVGSLPAPQLPVLVDFVDQPNNTSLTNLPGCTSTDPNSPLYSPNPTNPNYKRIPKDSSQNTSFFVCVKTNEADENLIANQDVIVYLRGNPSSRVGDRTEPLETLKTQAIIRGVIDKKPQ